MLKRCLPGAAVKASRSARSRPFLSAGAVARNSAGKAIVKDFEATPEPAAPANAVAETENTNDEIKLF